jgi:spermidine dehydrogenase
MSGTRREFLKFVVAGSVAAGCPIDLSLLAAPDDSKTQIEGDNFEICHQVRDGHSFSRPPVSKHYDVIIVGGGASGLAAAYFLRQYDFLLLEKEPHFGGNAYLEEFEGQPFATGSAYDEKGTASEQLAREIGLTLLPVNCPDPTILNGKWIKDTWRSGIDELPYSAPIRESFKKFRDEMLAIDISKNVEQLDNTPLTKYLSAYPPEIKSWWDAYGPSNWGAKSVDTSTYVALIDFQDVVAAKEDVRVTLPGGNGALTHKLAETLQSKSADRLAAGATIISVEPQKTEVRITYMQEGALHSVAAKFVIMATPKFITSRIVAGLPDAQQDAMAALRYCPYPVINMIFDRPVYNRGYDTWAPGNSFTDFIVADWVLQKQTGYKQKNNILTFYTALAEVERKKLLKIDDCRQIAANVLRDFQKLLPEFAAANPLEVHFYRRGHPMFMATPGTFTKTIPAASQPLERIFFANTDSVGPESEISGAVESGQKSAEWVEKRLAGASASSVQALARSRA